MKPRSFWSKESFCAFVIEMNPDSILVEVAVDSTESAVAAARGGAHRVELFSDPLEGGVTPSYGLITVTRERVSIPLHVLVRPRRGDFCYSPDEFEAMKRDVGIAKQLGGDGIAVGVLDIDGQIDKRRLRELIELARPMEVTFHRAFDMTPNLQESLDTLIACGVDRVLTSGGEQNALKGAEKIAQLVAVAGTNISVMAGGGVRPENVGQILSTTGVREIHAGLRSTVRSPMRYRNEHISMGLLAGREYERLVVLEESVRELVRAVE
jgi:copper homeostasis protein